MSENKDDENVSLGAKINYTPYSCNMLQLATMQAAMKGQLARKFVKQLINKGSVKAPGEVLSPGVQVIYQRLGPYQVPRSATREFALIGEPTKLLDGSVYTGERDAMNRITGIGKSISKTGQIYEGNFLEGKFKGNGRLIHSDGRVYTGDWEEDKKQGQGRMDFSDGSSYIGEWQNDQIHGFGREQWQSGSYFEGEFRYGVKNGKGIFQWEDGKSYEGEFANGDLSGSGTFKWPNGKKYVGQYKQNKMHGKGVFTWKDGRKYEGEYVNDLKNGKGIFTRPDGKIYDGSWKAGKQDGEGIFQNKSMDSPRKGLWKDGKRVKWIQKSTQEPVPSPQKSPNTPKTPRKVIPMNGLINKADDQLLTLKQNVIEGSISDMVGKTTITQTYVNEQQEPIDAEFSFISPENTEIRSLVIQSDDGKITKALISDRQTYAAASDKFVQSVGNFLQPGQSVRITLVTEAPCTQEEGQWRFAMAYGLLPKEMHYSFSFDLNMSNSTNITDVSASNLIDMNSDVKGCSAHITSSRKPPGSQEIVILFRTE